MLTVVSDTGPLNYLILIGLIDLLHKLFGTILVPDVVFLELTCPAAPLPVRDWMSAAPGWVVIEPATGCDREDHPSLDAGERAVIDLAQARKADLTLMDDRAAVAAARTQGLTVLGTLGILLTAADTGLIALEDAFLRLRATSFRCRPSLLDEILARQAILRKR